MAIDSRPFSDDPLTGKTVIFHHDDDSGQVTFETQQQVGGVIEQNQAHFAATDERAPWKDGLNHVCSIPMPLWWAIKVRCEQFGLDFDKTLRDLVVNNPDFRKFRSRPGRI